MFSYFLELIEQLKNKDVNTPKSKPFQNKNAETQTSAVLSIQIAKVQGDVEWQDEGKFL